MFFKGGGGNALKEFNVFTGTTPPTTFDGIWLKTADTFKNLQVRHDIDVEGTWTTPSGILQAPITLKCGGIVDDKYYCPKLDGNYDDKTYIYNLTTNTWSNDGQNIPSSLDATYNQISSCTTPNKEIYYVGGYGPGNASPSSMNVMFNGITGTYTSKAPMPMNNYSGDVTYYDGWLYRISSGNNRFLRYNIATNIWETLAIPTFDNFDCGNVIGYQGIIYIFNGYLMVAYNISTNTFSSLVGSPSGVDQLNGRSDKMLYLIGSNIHSIGSSTHLVFGIATKTWTRLADNPQSMMLVAGGEYQNKLYLFGANNGGFIYNLKTSNMANESFVVLQGSQYPVVLANSKNLTQTQLIQNAWIYKNSALQNCEGYYGNGTQWIKFK